MATATGGVIDKKAKHQETSPQSLQQKDKLIAVVGAAINGLSNVLLRGVTLDPAIFSEEIKATIENSLNHLAKVVSSQGIGQNGSSGSTMEHEFTASPSPIPTEHLDGSRGTTAEIADQPETLLVENENGMEQNDNPDVDVTLQAQVVESAKNTEQVQTDNIPQNDGVVDGVEQIDNSGELEVENIAVGVPHELVELEDIQVEPSHEHGAKEIVEAEKTQIEEVCDVELTSTSQKKAKIDKHNLLNYANLENENSVKTYQMQNFEHHLLLQKAYDSKRKNENQPPTPPNLSLDESSSILPIEQEEPQTNGKESEAGNNDEMDTDDGVQKMEIDEATVNATTSQRETDCCEKEGLMYEVSNLMCGNISGECRIREGHEYYKSESSCYCAPCFNSQEINPSDKAEYRHEVHIKNIKEEILRCVLCKRNWHKTCYFEKTGIAFTPHKNALFMCTCSIDPREEMPTAESIKETRLSQDAEKDVNMKLQRMIPNLKKEEHVLIRELSYVQAEALISRLRFPDYTLKQFKELYGNSVKYRKRTLAAYQKKDGKVQLFLMIFLQQYRDLQKKEGNNWQVLQYLDTVPHAQRPGGMLSGTVMNSVMYQVSRMGYDKAFVWAKPPQQGDDYVFNKHPKSQEMPDLNKLLLFYNKSFEHAEAAGEIENVETFEEYFKDKKPITLFDIPMFHNSLWDIMINWADYTMKKEKLWKKGTPKHQQIMTVMEIYFQKHKEDNFFIVFKNNNDRIVEDEPEMIPVDAGRKPKTASKIFSSRDEFLTLCVRNNWVFSDERHGAFSTAAITKHYTDMKKKEELAANASAALVPLARLTRKRRA
ncbi:hypothetical protein CRE_17282 [Caenorhabditis remanei]|uniref:histone acetyltransferase n=1 Tax=Caenorhabditis remanei TaxID=31234 RepID=E3MAI8_CAERE|nr:hypothetical protein CRE_17282 [Caenorhabditis remanei]